jgi:hypothetical protein
MNSKDAAHAFGARAEATGYLPPRLSPAFGSSLISLRETPGALGTGDGALREPINDCASGSRRRCALRSEFKEEPAAKG